MNTEQRLNQVADRYRAQGYNVIVHPGEDALPPFAKDFKVDILATRSDGGVLVSANKSPRELQQDLDLARYAEVTNKQKGWRYDVFVLGPDDQPMPEQRDAKEPSEPDIRKALNEAETILQAGFVNQSFIAAWATLESAMRWRLRAEGMKSGWGTSPRTMLNELFSNGVLPNDVFRDLEGYFQLRNVIVHGFSPPEIEPSAVGFLVDTARKLLDEKEPAKQTA